MPSVVKGIYTSPNKEFNKKKAYFTGSREQFLGSAHKKTKVVEKNKISEKNQQGGRTRRFNLINTKKLSLIKGKKKQ